jgi:ornithine decarboxylase
MRNGLQWYYLDDGVYGCYSGRVFDHADYTFHLLGNHSTESFPSVVSGPTCDSFDIVYDNIQLPKLEIGALIVSTTMGAYSSATATDFNFFPRTKIITVD